MPRVSCLFCSQDDADHSDEDGGWLESRERASGPPEPEVHSLYEATSYANTAETPEGSEDR